MRNVNERAPHLVDFDFISGLEGACVTSAYVPDARGSKSGVTIATGFDLGARNKSDLIKLMLSPALIDLLTPYLGLQGVQALQYVEAHPVSITVEQAKEIDTAVKNQVIIKLMRKYRDDARIAYSDLPNCWQTVIASVEFQYGSVQKKCPTFWRYVTKQDWPSAIAELRDFGDRYATRRNKEADYASQYA